MSGILFVLGFFAIILGITSFLNQLAVNGVLVTWVGYIAIPFGFVMLFIAFLPTPKKK